MNKKESKLIESKLIESKLIILISLLITAPMSSMTLKDTSIKEIEQKFATENKEIVEEARDEQIERKGIKNQYDYVEKMQPIWDSFNLDKIENKVTPEHKGIIKSVVDFAKRIIRTKKAESGINPDYVNDTSVDDTSVDDTEPTSIPVMEYTIEDLDNEDTSDEDTSVDDSRVEDTSIESETEEPINEEIKEEINIETVTKYAIIATLMQKVSVVYEHKEQIGVAILISPLFYFYNKALWNIIKNTKK